jgi:hypothetical protein
MKQPISVRQAAEMLGITDIAVLKRIAKGQLLAVPLCGKGLLVCVESVQGKKHDPEEFRRLCDRYISVPQACDIVCVTDGRIGRMLASGILKGFRLNEKAWAVERKSCEDNIREYMENPPAQGRKRLVGESRAPKQRPKGRSPRKKSA